MEMKSKDETLEVVFEFAEKLIGLQLQKKSIDEEIKELKNEYKEEGIATSIVTKVINKMKAEMKKTPGELLEEDILTEKIKANDSIRDMVSSLI